MWRALAKRFFNTTKTVKVHIKMEGETDSVSLPEGKKLARCLQ